MKKILITALSLILTASVFAGCADNSQNSESSESSENSENNQGSQNSESTQSSESTESSTESTQSTPESTQSAPESTQIEIGGQTFPVPIETLSVIEENNKSIELTDEQKAVIDTVFEDYAKMALLFFYNGFDMGKDYLPQFDDTGYDCKTLPINETNTDGVPEEIVKGLTTPGFVKYTGDKVNTLEKFNAERAKYFTGEFIERNEPTEPYFEANGALYKSCLESDHYKCNYYIHKYEETDDEINIGLFCVSAHGEASCRNLSLNLKKTENGFLVNSIKNSDGEYDEKIFAEFPVSISY